jgi:inosine/xanthosine triphosphatase
VTVFIGSTRPAKVEGARDALAAVARLDARFVQPDIQTHDLTAIAPTMPMSVAEIVRGARVRARALVRLPAFMSPADLAVGLEGGLDALVIEGKRLWMLETWAAVSDGSRWGLGAGPALMLPDAVAHRVLAGEELGDVIDELAGVGVRGTRGAWGLLTCDAIGRRDAFRLAVTAALAPFFNAAMWQ